MNTVPHYPIAFATDTVYGLGAPVNDKEAIDRLYILKNRPHTQPMQMLVSSREMTRQWLAIDDEDPIDASSRIYAPRDEVINILDPRLIYQGGVAVRLPNQLALCDLIDNLGLPLAASSANGRGEAPLLTAEAVRMAFPDIPLMIAGLCAGIPSEVWDMRKNPPKRLR